MSGVITGVADYSSQINTDIASNPATCSQFGYSSCQTWEQFIYSTDSDGDASDGRTPVVFIQDWFFAGSASQYNSVGCPSGWHAYPENALTPENVMKAEVIAPRRGVLDFAAADAFVAYAQGHRQFVVGHTLV